MKSIVSYTVKIGDVGIECFTSQTHGNDANAFEKAKDFYNNYLVKKPDANLSIVKSVKKDKVKWL